jgi:hypothetical protein
MSDHRLKITVRDGYVSMELLHPEAGCVPARDAIQGDIECWAQGWVDNCHPEDLIHGTVSMEVPVSLCGDGDDEVRLLVGDRFVEDA